MKYTFVILALSTLFACSKNNTNYVYDFKYKSYQISKDTSIFAGSNIIFEHQLDSTEMLTEQNKLIQSTETQLKISIRYSEFTLHEIDTNGKWD